MKFPDDWPADCPPDAAAPAKGEVYRLVKADPPTADEFETHFEKGTLKNEADAVMKVRISSLFASASRGKVGDQQNPQCHFGSRAMMATWNQG